MKKRATLLKEKSDEPEPELPLSTVKEKNKKAKDKKYNKKALTFLILAGISFLVVFFYFLSNPEANWQGLAAFMIVILLVLN
jgi:uncharacterized membrane protein